MALSPDNPVLTNGQAPDQQPAPSQQPPDGQAPPPIPQTPEEVEAIWRNRFSQRDRAHNAEVESLRQQLEAAQRTADASTAGQPAAPDSYKARFEQTQRELQEERNLRAITERRVRYQALAQEVPSDDPMWTSARDETLARLNATYGAPPPPPPTGHVDVNNPPRQPVTPVNYDNMTKEDLLRELQKLSPGEEARWRDAQFGG